MLRNHVKTLYTFTFFCILKCNEISIASAQNQFYIVILFTTLIYIYFNFVHHFDLHEEGSIIT